MKRWRKTLLTCTTILVIVGMIGYGLWRERYPYGRSHCCDKGLYMALQVYAQDHGGRFPSGASSPEASLSLLYAEDFINAYTLGGKTVSEAKVKARLESGQLLIPELCDWHYVEGLSQSSDQRLALFWDKSGLGHNGERVIGGGHAVVFVDGGTRHVPASEWQSFLAEQQALLSQQSASEK